MSKKRNRRERQTNRTTQVVPYNPGLPDRLKTGDHQRAIEATRSFYSNAVAWGTNLLTDARDEYSVDDVTAARLYAISVTAWACANYRAGVEAGIAPQVVFTATEEPVEQAENPIKWFTDNAEPLMLSISTSLLIWGKFFVLKERNLSGVPTRLRWLSPLDVSPITDYQDQTFSGYRVRGIDRTVPPSDMIVALTFDPLNDFDGVSPYEVAMRQVIGARELIRFGQKYFQDGTMLGGMLSYEGDLTDEEYKLMKADMEQFKGSQNAFKTFIAGGGLAKFSYTPMQPMPVDLAMAELKGILDGDTCRAFGVNPVLIGIGDAKDPLSAQNTYQQIEDKFVHNTAVPRVRWIYAALNEQWLQRDFSAFGNYKIMPDLAEINSESKATTDRTTIATTNAGRIWSVNEAREYTGQGPIPFGIPLNPDWATAVWNAGGIRLNEYRYHIGLQPVEVDGFIWEVDPRAKSQPPSQLSFNMPHNQQQIPANVEDQKKNFSPTGAGAVRSDEAVYCLLSLANDPTLAAIQADLIATMPGVEWESPADWHITLVYCTAADNLATIQNILPKAINPFTFDVTGFDTFEATEVAPLVLAVQPSDALRALQSGLYGAFSALGLPMSEYSESTAWRAHITLGYMPVGTELPPDPMPFELSSAVIICSVERGDSFQNIYITRSADAVRAETAGQIAELEMWSKKVRKFGADVQFEPAALTMPIYEYVRDELAGMWPAKAVFDEARAAIRGNRPPKLLGASQEDAAEYWREFDAIQHGIGEAWLEYHRAVSDEIFEPLVEQRAGVDIDRAMSSHHNDLIEKWVGTYDKPGDILKLLLAGMRSGQVSLEREGAANPQKPRAAGTGTFLLNTNWDLASQEAVTFARNYSYNLIRGVDSHTRAVIADAIAKYSQQSTGYLKTIEDLRKEIARALVPPGGKVPDDVKVRAAAIAQTESMRAYNSGAVNRWNAAGVSEATFNTVRDAHVCPICRPLFGVRANIQTGWPNNKSGNNSVPPMHVNCRCFMRPVVSTAAAVQTPTPVAPPPVQLPVQQITPVKKIDPTFLDVRQVLAAHRADLDSIDARLTSYEIDPAYQHAKTEQVKLDRLWRDKRDEIYDYERKNPRPKPDFPPGVVTPKYHHFKKPNGRTDYNAYDAAMKTVEPQALNFADIAKWDAEKAKREKEAEDLIQQRDQYAATLLDMKHNAFLTATNGMGQPMSMPVSTVAPKFSKDKEMAERLTTAREWLGKALDGNVYSGTVGNNPIGVKALRSGGRAFFSHNDKAVNLSPENGPEVYIHEWGHAIEFNDPQVHDRCVEFLIQRAEDSANGQPVKAKSLRALTGIKAYGNDEEAFEDKFYNPYVGKTYRTNKYVWDAVTGKYKQSTVPDSYDATEVLSMGIEALFEDPIKFRSDDREHYDFTISILRGYYHK